MTVLKQFQPQSQSEIVEGTIVLFLKTCPSESTLVCIVGPWPRGKEYQGIPVLNERLNKYECVRRDNHKLDMAVCTVGADDALYFSKHEE